MQAKELFFYFLLEKRKPSDYSHSSSLEASVFELSSFCTIGFHNGSLILCFELSLLFAVFLFDLCAISLSSMAVCAVFFHGYHSENILLGNRYE